MKTTVNYGLKKPDGTDVVNIDDFNYNADIIDKKIKEVDNKASIIKIPVDSVNGKTGAVTLVASDVGAETPGNASAKANTAESNAKAYTDGKIKVVETHLADIAKLKAGSSTFTNNTTTQTFMDSFCTTNSLVTISITSATKPQGMWFVNSAAGSFTITSTAAESADITFDYFIQKAVG